MEDEGRPLPNGWIRQFDSKTTHQFFVDTNATPPRSIWHHPYDDDKYLRSLDSKERARVQGLHKTPSHADVAAESSDDDGEDHKPGAHSKTTAASGLSSPGRKTPELPPRNQPQVRSGFGRRMKDRMTGTTHEQREAQRRQREQEERATYERHQMIRLAMQKAAETGQPQKIGKDKNGKDVFIEPPNGVDMPQGARGYNPYSQGPYSYGNSNATYIRPNYGYSRPYGGGYGGGYGLPLAGGLMGGLLLGDMMGGGMGMGGMGMMGGMGGGGFY